LCSPPRIPSPPSAITSNSNSTKQEGPTIQHHQEDIDITTPLTQVTPSPGAQKRNYKRVMNERRQKEQEEGDQAVCTPDILRELWGQVEQQQSHTKRDSDSD